MSFMLSVPVAIRAGRAIMLVQNAARKLILDLIIFDFNVVFGSEPEDPINVTYVRNVRHYAAAHILCLVLEPWPADSVFLSIHPQMDLLPPTISA